LWQYQEQIEMIYSLEFRFNPTYERLQEVAPYKLLWSWWIFWDN
jgi:hypothetical protein